MSQLSNQQNKLPVQYKHKVCQGLMMKRLLHFGIMWITNWLFFYLHKWDFIQMEFTWCNFNDVHYPDIQGTKNAHIWMDCFLYSVSVFAFFYTCSRNLSNNCYVSFYSYIEWQTSEDTIAYCQSQSQHLIGVYLHKIGLSNFT